MKITSVTPIAAVNSQYILIQGKGFGNTPPQTTSLGDGSVDTQACKTQAPSIAITDNAGGQDSWSAGRDTCANNDLIGIIPNANPSPGFWWSDNLIVLWGFGSALGGSFQIATGDPMQIKVFGPGNRHLAVYNERVVPLTPKAPKGATTVTVQGNQGLTDTGLAVTAGQDVSIRAAGLITFATDGRPPISPAGFPPSCNVMGLGSGGFPAPQLPCESLIGQIGSGGPIFEVGTKLRLRATASGDLFLGVNDNHLSDNSGGWTVAVSLR